MYQWLIDIKTLRSNASFSKCQASQQDLVLETDGNFNYFNTVLVFSVSLFNSTLHSLTVYYERSVQVSDRKWWGIEH